MILLSAFCLVLVPLHHMQSAPQGSVKLHVITDYHILDKQYFTSVVRNTYYYIDTACSNSTTTSAETLHSHMP